MTSGRLRARDAPAEPGIAPRRRRGELVRFFCSQRSEPDEVETLTDEVETFIEATLPHHGWPGNVRELKRCVESVYATDSFEPLDPAALKRPAGDDDDPLRSVRALELSEEQVPNRAYWLARRMHEESTRREALAFCARNGLSAQDLVGFIRREAVSKFGFGFESCSTCSALHASGRRLGHGL